MQNIQDVSEKTYSEVTTQRMFMAIGGLLEAHKMRGWIRGKVGSAQLEVKDATASFKDFGVYEDCATVYGDALLRASASQAAVANIKLKMDRHFKRIRYELLERYPKALDILKVAHPEVLVGWVSSENKPDGSI